MHPESVLLPLSYGVASVLTIGCLTLSLIALIGGTFVAAASRATAGHFTIRPAKAWMFLVAWSGITGWISAGYRDQYHFAITSLAAQQPAIPDTALSSAALSSAALSDTAANAALIEAINPTVWAVKTILLILIGGFLWVGTTRARAAAALLLAHSQGVAQPCTPPSPFTGSPTPPGPLSPLPTPSILEETGRT